MNILTRMLVSYAMDASTTKQDIAEACDAILQKYRKTYLQDMGNDIIIGTDGKWNPQDHPKGKNGRFVTKGISREVKTKAKEARAAKGTRYLIAGNEPKDKEANARTRSVGTINRKVLAALNVVIDKDDVIITSERIEHSNQHDGAYEKYGGYIPEILSDPDFILADKHPRTAKLVKRVPIEDNKSLLLVLRVHAEEDNPDFTNSVLSLWDIGESRRKTYENSKKVIYRREE